MANRYLGPRIESEVPEVRVSVETAKIGLAEIHQNPEGTFGVAAIFAVIGFRNRVRKRVIRIGSRQHLLHLEFSPCATGDNRFGPLVDRLALLSPVLLGRIPGATIFQLEWDQIHCGCVDACGFNDAGQVRSPGIIPSLARPDRGDLTGNHIPEATAFGGMPPEAVIRASVSGSVHRVRPD